MKLLEGYGHRPYLVSGDDPEKMHQKMAATLDAVFDEISDGRSPPPMIVLRTPKGWTGPKEVDGLPVEGMWRSHQVPLADVHDRPDRLRELEGWMRSYRPEELFDAGGRPVPLVTEMVPHGWRRMSANPHANGGEMLRPLVVLAFTTHAVDVKSPASHASEPTRVLGAYLRDVIAANPSTFRLMGPDETASNRLSAVF